MFSCILIPTDGSPAAAAVMRNGIAFAREQKASVVGLFVAPRSRYPIYIDAVPPSYLSDEDYLRSMTTIGETLMSELKQRAGEEGVECACEIRFNDAVASEIVHVAERHGCDLIFIGRQGQSGAQILPGSVALKVLSLAPMPVLIFRGPEL